MAIELMYVTVEMRDLDDTATSVVNPSMSDISNTSQSQQPVVMTSLPRKLNDADDTGTRVAHNTEAATSCDESLTTVHTNKGFFLKHYTIRCFINYIKY